MEVTKLVAVTLFKPAPAPSPLVARMKIAGPTSGAASIQSDSVGTHATDWRITSRFPDVRFHLRAGVEISSVTARDIRIVGGVFGVIRHGRTAQTASSNRDHPTPKLRPPKQSGVQNSFTKMKAAKQPGVQKAPKPPPSRSPWMQSKELLWSSGRSPREPRLSPTPRRLG